LSSRTREVKLTKLGGPGRARVAVRGIEHRLGHAAGFGVWSGGERQKRVDVGVGVGVGAGVWLGVGVVAREAEAGKESR
jgi:hypothetical protein